MQLNTLQRTPYHLAASAPMVANTQAHKLEAASTESEPQAAHPVQARLSANHLKATLLNNTRFGWPGQGSSNNNNNSSNNNNNSSNNNSPGHRPGTEGAGQGDAHGGHRGYENPDDTTTETGRYDDLDLDNLLT